MKNDVDKRVVEFEFDNSKFDKNVKKLDVPVYLFQGDHDQNTPTILAKAWFDQLEAPYKEYVAFKESAHSPIKEEATSFSPKFLIFFSSKLEMS